MYCSSLASCGEGEWVNERCNLKSKPYMAQFYTLHLLIAKWYGLYYIETLVTVEGTFLFSFFLVIVTVSCCWMEENYTILHSMKIRMFRRTRTAILRYKKKKKKPLKKALLGSLFSSFTCNKLCVKWQNYFLSCRTHLCQHLTLSKSLPFPQLCSTRLNVIIMRGWSHSVRSPGWMSSF